MTGTPSPSPPVPRLSSDHALDVDPYTLPLDVRTLLEESTCILPGAIAELWRAVYALTFSGDDDAAVRYQFIRDASALNTIAFHLTGSVSESATPPFIPHEHIARGHVHPAIDARVGAAERESVAILT